MVCSTVLHDAHGREVRRCGGTMILRNPDHACQQEERCRLNHLKLPVFVCTNPMCGTAITTDQQEPA